MTGGSVPHHHVSSKSRAAHFGGHRRQVFTVKRRVHAVLLGGWSPGPLPYLSRFFLDTMATRRSTIATVSREEVPTSSLVAASSTLPQQYDVDVIDVTPNLPMPPIPSTAWCCCTVKNPRLLMIWIVFGGLIYLLYSLPSIMVSETSYSSILMTFLRTVIGIIIVIWFRFVVVPTVVRASIDKGIEATLHQLSTPAYSSSQRWLLSGIGSTPTNEDRDFHAGGNEAEDEADPMMTILIGFSWGAAVRRRRELFGSSQLLFFVFN